MQDDKKDLNISTEELNKLRQEVQSLRTDIKNINVRFQQLQESIDGQKLNHRLYFDNIENSLASLKIMLDDILSPKISAIEKSIAAESKNNSIIGKNLSSLEELMRLIVANQMLNNLEIKKPPIIKSTAPPSLKKVKSTHGKAEIAGVAGQHMRLYLNDGYIAIGDKLKVSSFEGVVRAVFDNYCTRTDKVAAQSICYIEVTDFKNNLIRTQNFSVGDTVIFI